MLSSLNSGVSGLEAFQQQMDVIGNNIANVNTNGYKAQIVDFADAFSNTFQTASGGTASTSGGNSIQVGTGVGITGVIGNFSQGAVQPTGIESNMAITGNGFFMVRDTSTNAQFATRTGNFTVDDQGYLITDSGDRVQGFTDATQSTVGDIRIDNTGGATGTSMVGYTVSSTGVITVDSSDGSTFTRGQILMQSFSDPAKLTNVGNNLYSNLTAAGALGNVAASGTNGLGTITSGSVELSNVDLSNEMAMLITAQRAFEANSKIITTSDEVLQTVVNMKR